MNHRKHAEANDVGNDDSRTPDLVGLLPCAGLARRIAPLPCSKELLPVGLQTCEDGSARPRPVCAFALESMRRAGARRAFVVVRKGKWDIPQFLGDGSEQGMDLAYLVMGSPWGTPFTLDQAYPFVHRSRVAFGFPDLVFEPGDLFERLVARQDETGAEVVLALFPASDPAKVDMASVDGEGRLLDLEIKQAGSKLRYTWIAAVWTPAFTRSMHEQLEARRPEFECAGTPPAELFVGDLILEASRRGMHVNSVTFHDGSFLDIGTPGDLARAMQLHFRPQENDR